MDPGFDGTSLALFTGLAPAGAVAIVALAFHLLAARMPAPAERSRANHLRAVPIFVSWAGFVASATHLGTPANALYAFTNVGTSPLSNEVTAAVVFLFFTGVYWLLSFNPRFGVVAQKVLLSACILSAVVFLAATSVAYDVPTVPTWSNPYVPASLIAGAVLGGCSVAALVLYTGSSKTRAWQRALVVLAWAALAAGTVLLVLYMGFLGGVGNNVASAGAAVGAFPAVAGFYVLAALAGLVAQWVALGKDGREAVYLASAGCVLVLIAVVAVRFPFAPIADTWPRGQLGARIVWHARRAPSFARAFRNRSVVPDFFGDWRGRATRVFGNLSARMLCIQSSLDCSTLCLGWPEMRSLP